MRYDTLTRFMLEQSDVLLFITICFSVSCVCQSLTDLVSQKEALVQQLADQALQLYRNRCSATCACSISSCSSDFPQDEMTCTEGFGGIDGCGSVNCNTSYHFIC